MSSARDFFSHYRKTRSRFLPRQWLHLASAIGSPVAADAACDWWEAVLGTKFCAACARVGVVACGLGGVVFFPSVLKRVGVFHMLWITLSVAFG